MASDNDNNDSTLGFNLPLKVVLLVGILLVVVGQVVEDSTEYAEPGDETQNTEATANLLMNLGSLVGATSLLLAGIMADRSHPALRGLLVFLGVVLVFSGFEFSFFTGFGG